MFIQFFRTLKYVSIFMFVNIFQTVYPRVADTWLANFESQLQGCVKHPAQREGLEVGETPTLAFQQDLQQGVVGDVQVPSQELVRGVKDRDRGAVVMFKILVKNLCVEYRI